MYPPSPHLWPNLAWSQWLLSPSMNFWNYQWCAVIYCIPPINPIYTMATVLTLSNSNNNVSCVLYHLSRYTILYVFTNIICLFFTNIRSTMHLYAGYLHIILANDSNYTNVMYNVSSLEICISKNMYNFCTYQIVIMIALILILIWHNIHITKKWYTNSYHLFFIQNK